MNLFRHIYILLFSLTICFAANSTVQGYITDSNTGETLIGANIMLMDTNMGIASDLDGAYMISDIPIGTYTLLAMFIGYESSNNFWKNSISFLNPISNQHPPIWILIITPLLVIFSIPLSYHLFLKHKKILEKLVKKNYKIYTFLLNKWYFDELYNFIFVVPLKKIGLIFWKKIDIKTIDHFGPDGFSKLIKFFSSKAVQFQNGYIYHYAFVMLVGFSILLTYLNLV